MSGPRTMPARTMPATVLGSDTIGVLVVTEVDENGHRCAQMEWQKSPLPYAPTITRAELVGALRAAADELEAGR